MNTRTILPAVAAVLLAVSGCRRAAAPEAAPPPGEQWLTASQIQGGGLRVEPVEARPLVLHLATSGRVAFDEQRVAHLFSPVSGRVTKILAHLGERVAPGTALAVIDSPDLASAWSDEAKAKADVVAAEHDEIRQRELYEHHAAAQKDFEEAEDNARKARAELSRTALRLRLLHVSPGDTATQQYVMRSPLHGEVVARTATPGLEVQGMLSSANVVQELFTVGSLDPVWVWGDIQEQDLGKVRRGEAIAITSVAYPGRLFGGVVDYVADVLDPQTRTAKIRCAVANPEGLLKPEMYVALSLEIGRVRALAIPRGALLKVADHRVVFVDEGPAPGGRRRFVQRQVDVEESDGEWIAVRDGLAPGERVVVSGSVLLTGESDEGAP